MVGTSNTGTRRARRYGIICVLLAVMCALTVSVIGISFTARAAETTVKGQTVDANGFRLTYEAQGIDRRKDKNDGLYDDTLAGLYTRVNLTNVVGIDNWGKPIDFTKRFRVHVATEQEREWMIFDIASTTDAANVNAVQGWHTIPGVQATPPIQADSIIHFVSNHGKRRVPTEASSTNVMWNSNSKGFASDNQDGSVKSGYIDYGSERRDYVYTFNFVSGDNEGERSTLTASSDTGYNSAGSDIFYLTDTQKTLEGKNGYFSANFNNVPGWHIFKLVHENSLTVQTKHGFSVTEIKTVERSGDKDIREVSVNSDSPKIWGGDLVKVKIGGTDAETAAALKVGDQTVLADQDGYWCFYMPDADTTISVESNQDVYYRVTYDSKGGSSVLAQNVREGESATKPTDPTKTDFVFEGWFKDEAYTQSYDFSEAVNANVNLYAKWTALHTVTYKIAGFNDITAKVKEGDNADEKNIYDGIRPAGVSDERLNGWKADNLSLTWHTDAEYAQAYDFTQAVTADTVIYGKLIETKQYKNPNAYGWDNLTKFTDDSDTQIIQSTHYAKPMLTEDDGTSLFNLTAQQEAVYSRGLDVTKDIYYNLSLNSPEANGNWFISALWDKLTLAQISYSDNYQHSYGMKTAFGINASTGAPLGHSDTVNVGSFLQGKVNTEGGVQLKYTIAETAADSALYIYNTETEEWNKVAALGAARSDFFGGKAYFSMAVFAGCEVNAKIWQEIADNAVTVQNDGNGTVNAEIVGGGSAIKITAAANEHFELDALTVNDVAANVNNRGFLTINDYTDISNGITVKATFKSDGTAEPDPDPNPNPDPDPDPDPDPNPNPNPNTNPAPKKKCGGAAGGASAAGAAAVLAAAAATVIIRRRKVND